MLLKRQPRSRAQYAIDGAGIKTGRLQVLLD
jgi:hypothetical protein